MERSRLRVVFVLISLNNDYICISGRTTNTLTPRTVSSAITYRTLKEGHIWRNGSCYYFVGFDSPNLISNVLYQVFFPLILAANILISPCDDKALL